MGCGSSQPIVVIGRQDAMARQKTPPPQPDPDLRESSSPAPSAPPTMRAETRVGGDDSDHDATTVPVSITDDAAQSPQSSSTINAGGLIPLLQTSAVAPIKGILNNSTTTARKQVTLPEPHGVSSFQPNSPSTMGGSTRKSNSPIHNNNNNANGGGASPTSVTVLCRNEDASSTWRGAPHGVFQTGQFRSDSSATSTPTAPGGIMGMFGVTDGGRAHRVPSTQRDGPLAPCRGGSLGADKQSYHSVDMTATHEDAFMGGSTSKSPPVPRGSFSPGYSAALEGNRHHSMVIMGRADSLYFRRGESLATMELSRTGRSFSMAATQKRKSKFFVAMDKSNISRAFSFGTIQGQSASAFVRSNELGRTPLCVAYMGNDPSDEVNGKNREEYVCRSILTGAVPYLIHNPTIAATLMDDLTACCSLNNKCIQRIHTVMAVESDSISPLPHIDIITEFYYEGTPELGDPLTDRKELRMLLKDVLTGLSFLHTNRKPHRHLTRSNVFKTLPSDGVAVGYLVGDIGMGHLFKKLPLEVLVQLDHTDSALFPPEVINGEYSGTLADDAACDLWALGLLMLTVSSGKRILPAPADVKTNAAARTQWLDAIVSDPIPSHFFDGLCDELRPIVQQMVNKDPRARGKMDAYMRMPCLRGGAIERGATLPLTLNPNLLAVADHAVISTDDLALPTATSIDGRKGLATVDEMPIVNRIVCSTCNKDDHAMVWVCDECLAVADDVTPPYMVCHTCKGAGNYDFDHPHPLRQYLTEPFTTDNGMAVHVIIPVENLTNHERTYFTTYRRLPSMLALTRRGLSLAPGLLGCRENSMSLTPHFSVGRLERTTTNTFKAVSTMNSKGVFEADQGSETAESEECDSPQAMSQFGGPKGAKRQLPACEMPKETTDELIAECLEDSGQFELVLADKALDTVPCALYDPPILHLTVLDLCENNLLEIPPGIQNLINLRKLYLGNNMLTELPECIGNLCDLDELDANHNRLTSLPQTLMFCDKLSQLTVDYNLFAEIPSVVFDLQSLASLFLAMNPIKVWPSADLLRIPSALHIGIDNEPTIYKYYKEHIAHDKGVGITVAWNRIYPDYIAPNLYCGSLRSAQTLSVYEQLSIGYVLTMGRGLEPVIPEGMKHKTIIVDDIPNAKIDVSFDDAVAFIDESIRSGKGCLVHCFAGLSRSATAVIAYLMVKQGMRLDDAYMLTKKGRPNIYPNDGFLKQLITLDEQLFPDGRPLDLAPLQRGVIPT